MSIHPKTPVITGIGISSPFGMGKKTFFESISEGKSGLSSISLFEPNGLKSRVVAEVNELNPHEYYESKEINRIPRVVSMAISASKEALEDAGIDTHKLTNEEARRIQVIVGSGAGGIDFAEKQYDLYFGGKSKRVTPYAISSSFLGMLSSEISIYFKLKGLSHVISTGCTSSTDAIGYAAKAIKYGETDLIITGGAEACITHGIMAGFDRMQVTSRNFNDTPNRASRPFNQDRDGFVLGEGSWIYILESYEHAKNRGAKMYAFVKGYGSTCDAYHRVLMTPDGEESARAIELALESAGISNQDVDYINLHGTSTQLNDSTETLAVKKALGDQAYKIQTSATKSMIGHPQGACGAAGVATCLLALNHEVIAPTINYENPDPNCDLNYTPNKAVKQHVRYALSNCIAFGSKNSCLVFQMANQNSLV